MTIPIGFISRLGIPLVVTALLFAENYGPDQVRLYDLINRGSDIILSKARKEGQGPTEVFDYIIIGGGSAGAVVANRLSASGQNSVLLLEGGGDPNPVSDILYAKRHINAAGDLSLPYRTVPQENACLEAGSCNVLRAKVLGGCSVINGAVYNRCNSKDYDLWANFTGDPLWSFSNVVQAFRNIENYHGAFEDNAGPNHGTQGEVYIGKVDYIPGSDVILEAMVQQGLPTVDLNSGLSPLGFSKIDLNVETGIRQSTYHAFIRPIEDRQNLKIYRYAWATKLHLDGNKKAIGVTYERHNQTVYVEASKEIILSAGVFDTPKLLMLSGIGPAEHLAEHNIPVEVASPAVGNYLQDHVTIRMLTHPYTVNQTFGQLNIFTDESILQYVENGTGPLHGLEVGGIWATPIAMGYIPSIKLNDSTWPDIQIFVHERIVDGNPIEEQFYLNHVLMRPESYGTVKLRSTDPYDSPVIDTKFFDNPDDLERLLDGVKMASDLLLLSPILQGIGIKWSESGAKIPACEEFSFPSREYWRCYTRQRSDSDKHQTSTCRMGPNSTVAAVDSKLRVYGVTGLRIVDASIMPFVPSGNTHFPTMMVGEMGAQIILQNL